MPPRKSAYYDEDDLDDGYSDEDEYWDEDDGEYEDDVAPGRQHVSRPTFLNNTTFLSPFLPHHPLLLSPLITCPATTTATQEFKT
jgi:hypothetical protein